jgi:hypothetical protein
MFGPRAGVLAATLLAAPAGLASSANAADAPHAFAGVRFAAPACPIAPVSVPAFVEALRVELASPAPPEDTTLVALAVEPCDTATTRVQVSATNTANGHGAARDVDLGDVTPDARPRALALAVAELVRGVRAPAVVAPPAPVLPPPTVVTIAEGSSPTLFALDAQAIAALYPSRDTTLWGGRVSVYGVSGRWVHGALGEITTGENSYADGRVELFSVGGGLFTGPRWAWRRATLSPGLVATIAYTQIAGRPASAEVKGTTDASPTIAVRARVAANFLTGRTLSLSALAEGGVVIRKFDSTVNGAQAAGIAGPSVVVGLGITFGP